MKMLKVCFKEIKNCVLAEYFIGRNFLGSVNKPGMDTVRMLPHKIVILPISMHCIRRTRSTL